MLAVTAENAAAEQLQGQPKMQQKEPRGYTIYNFTQLQSMSARAKSGEMVSVQTERPYFELSTFQRMDIFRKCDMVFGVVTSRMNRISSTPWKIIPVKKIEDRIASELKGFRDTWNEYKDIPDEKYQIIRGFISKAIMKQLPDCLPDLRNFESSLMRWKKRLDFQKQDKAAEITEWIRRPNINDDWEEFAKKFVQDLMVHGTSAVFKEAIKNNDGNEMISNFYVLPGGTVLPLKGKYVGTSVDGYIQITDTMNAQVMFGDEVAFCQYIPTSARAYGFVPIEALVNKVAESLFFDKLMASQADGTRPPEKVVVFGEQSPFGDFEEADQVPMDSDKQKRLETQLNEPRKTAIRTLSGVGTPLVLDLSKADTMAIQNQRQKDMRESVALVFNMSNMEVNLSGGDSTSGRSTSEEQGKIDYTKGVYPIMAMLQRVVNEHLIPFRYGEGYRFEFDSGLSELAELQKHKTMLEAGFSVNEVREERGQPRIADEAYDKPAGAGASVPGDSEMSPMFTKQV